MTIAEFDHFDLEKKKELLKSCCGSERWVGKMLKKLPANDLVDLLEDADDAWDACTQDDWREAFPQQPMIDDTYSLNENYSSSADGTTHERVALKDSHGSTLKALAEGNKEYHEKFGYNFTVFTGDETGQELLQWLQQRLLNKPEDEIKIAAAEQIRITKDSLKKLFA